MSQISLEKLLTKLPIHPILLIMVLLVFGLGVMLLGYAGVGIAIIAGGLFMWLALILAGYFGFL